MDNTLSGPVDVLAVLDRLIGNARTIAGMTGDPVMRDNLRDGEKARAAVAGLIEALSLYTAVCGNTCAMVTRETAAEMHAKGTTALANIRSAK